MGTVPRDHLCPQQKAGWHFLSWCLSFSSREPSPPPCPGTLTGQEFGTRPSPGRRSHTRFRSRRSPRLRALTRRLRATMSGVSLWQFLRPLSAPLRTRVRTRGRSPRPDAECSAELPEYICAFTLAPCWGRDSGSGQHPRGQPRPGRGQGEGRVGSGIGASREPEPGAGLDRGWGHRRVRTRTKDRPRGQAARHPSALDAAAWRT